MPAFTVVTTRIYKHLKIDQREESVICPFCHAVLHTIHYMSYIVQSGHHLELSEGSTTETMNP